MPVDSKSRCSACKPEKKPNIVNCLCNLSRRDRERVRKERAATLQTCVSSELQRVAERHGTVARWFKERLDEHRCTNSMSWLDFVKESIEAAWHSLRDRLESPAATEEEWCALGTILKDMSEGKAPIAVNHSALAQRIQECWKIDAGTLNDSDLEASFTKPEFSHFKERSERLRKVLDVVIPSKFTVANLNISETPIGDHWVDFKRLLTTVNEHSCSYLKIMAISFVDPDSVDFKRYCKSLNANNFAKVLQVDNVPPVSRGMPTTEASTQKKLRSIAGIIKALKAAEDATVIVPLNLLEFPKLLRGKFVEQFVRTIDMRTNSDRSSVEGRVQGLDNSNAENPFVQFQVGRKETSDAISFTNVNVRALRVRAVHN